MLKAGTAKLCSFATSKITLPVVNIAVLPLITSALDCAGCESADEPALEEQEQDQHWNGAENAHCHHLIPLVGMLSHQQLDTDRHGSHIVCPGQGQREQVLVPREHERV